MSRETPRSFVEQLLHVTYRNGARWGQVERETVGLRGVAAQISGLDSMKHHENSYYVTDRIDYTTIVQRQGIDDCDRWSSVSISLERERRDVFLVSGKVTRAYRYNHCYLNPVDSSVLADALRFELGREMVFCFWWSWSQHIRRQYDQKLWPPSQKRRDARDSARRWCYLSETSFAN